MKITHGTIVLASGRRVRGTKICESGLSIVTKGWIEKKRADRIISGLKKSRDRYREFNRRNPTKLVRRKFDFDTPFIRIGKVPVVTYESRKEGKLKSYRHNTKRMPTLYYHPTKPVGLLVGGSIKVRDWLYD